MNKIDELAIGRLHQTHELQSSKPKDRTFQMGLKIVSLEICDKQNKTLKINKCLFILFVGTIILYRNE